MNKRMHWTLFVVLSLFSPALLALGLGGAVVESYLNQPLDVRVELITQSEEELQSITAGLASAGDFQLLGLSRTAITVPLAFEVKSDADRPYVHITSDLNITEPVVQVLVEIVWASGRMLREYTLFLDPPTIESMAPPVVVKPAPVKTPPVETKSETVAPIQKAAQPRVEKAEAPEVAAPSPDSETGQPSDSAITEPEPEQVPEEEPEQTTDEESEQVPEEEPEQTTDEESEQVPEEEPEQTTDEEPEQETEQAQEPYSEDEVRRPVARGETLWGIARDYSKGSGYSINQTMLALQRKNPEAFIKGNINLLKAGAILRLPAFNELSELTSREALLEVVRQEEEIRTGIRSVAPDFDTPTVADSGDYQATVDEVVPEPEVEEDAGHLELVPAAEELLLDLPTSELEPAQNVAVESMQDELSRTEEELVNARQENTYLADRIEELEAEAKAREEQSVAIEDSGLANLESKLAEQRADGQPEPPLAITPGGEKQAWYAGMTPLIVGVIAALIALIVWGLRRRSTGLIDAQRASEVQAISDDAEDILKTLDSNESEGETVVQAKPELEPEPEPESEPEPEPEPEPKPEPESREFPHIPYSEEDAPTVVVQTPETAIEADAEPDTDVDGEGEGREDDDPEIKLDLARAYLSLGDKEASKSMLDEVLKSGNEEQKAEALQMLEEL